MPLFGYITYKDNENLSICLVDLGIHKSKKTLNNLLMTPTIYVINYITLNKFKVIILL